MQNIEFLRNIAKGYNPFTGKKFSNDDILRNPDVVSRLYELIFELTEFKNKPNKEKIKAYNITPDILQTIQINTPNTTISYIAENVAKATGLGKSAVNTKIREYLIANGYLEVIPTYGENKKFATDLGKSVGITNVETISQLGTKYTNVHYSAEAQQFIISKLPEILN